ncbi:MAG: hypothetical protein AAGC73_08045 [Verrucomicrobiota bacterium]
MSAQKLRSHYFPDFRPSPGLSWFVSVFCLAALAVGTTQGAIIVHGIDRAFTGKSDPSGGALWLQVQFDDVAASNAGDVRLTSFANNLTCGEFVPAWRLNFTSAYDADDLSFNLVERAGVSLLTISRESNDFKADGTGGHFDILFESAGSNSADRFTLGDYLIYDPSFSGGSIVAGDFNFLSVDKNKKKGGYSKAAHIQNLSGGGFNWVGDKVPVSSSPNPIILPEPSMLRLSGLIFTYVATCRHRPISNV